MAGLLQQGQVKSTEAALSYLAEASPTQVREGLLFIRMVRRVSTAGGSNCMVVLRERAAQQASSNFIVLPSPTPPSLPPTSSSPAPASRPTPSTATPPASPPTTWTAPPTSTSSS